MSVGTIFRWKADAAERWKKQKIWRGKGRKKREENRREAGHDAVILTYRGIFRGANDPRCMNSMYGHR